MAIIRWLVKPRINYLDLIWISVSTRLFMDGYWMMAVVVAISGVVISVFAERATGQL